MGTPAVPPAFAAAALGLAAAAAALPLGRRRVRQAVLLLVLPALALAAALLPLLFAGTASLGGAALALAAAAAAGVLFARLLPRLATFALLVPCGAFLGAGSVEPRALRLALLGLSLALAALVARSHRLGLRVALALWAAALLGRTFPALGRPLAEAGAALLLVGAGLLLERFTRPARLSLRESEPASGGRTALGAVALAAGCAAAVGFAVLSLPRLVPSAPGDSPRRARLAAAVPEGGIVWPLPSETIAWTEADASEYPWLDVLDARWLTGAPTRGPLFVGASAGAKGSRSSRFSLHGEVVKLRALKDASEMAEMRRAAEATVLSARDVLPLVKAGAREADLAKAFAAACRRHGAEGESFPAVASSGPAAAAIHGDGNLGVLAAGTLLVLDVGCRTPAGYASDFTRTLPVGGRFTERQRKVVDAVFAAQADAQSKCRPGAFLSGRGLEKGAVSLDAGARAVLRSRLGEEHMKHGLGHGVGLFVHDPLPRGPLAAGMVVTLEPGTYLDGELGSRVEDTYEVTSSGCVPLTAGLPGDPASIEKAMAEASGAPPLPAR